MFLTVRPNPIQATIKIYAYERYFQILVSLILFNKVLMQKKKFWDSISQFNSIKFNVNRARKKKTHKSVII